MAEPKLTGVMGAPVGHSLSPLIHCYWIKKYELQAEYIPLPVLPEQLTEALHSLKFLGFCGVNLTIPHKEKAYTQMKWLSPSAQAIGAVNTVKVEADGTLTGDNTDAQGYLLNLQQDLGQPERYFDQTVILGAGGAARAIVFALKQAGAKNIYICNRTLEKAQALADAFDVNVIAWQNRQEQMRHTSLLVNTTSLGMQGKAALDIDLSEFPQSGAVSDIVYRPKLTQLLRQAQMRGCRTSSGLGMLLYQAVPAFESWFGVRPQVDESLVRLLEEQLEQ